MIAENATLYVHSHDDTQRPRAIEKPDLKVAPEEINRLQTLSEPIEIDGELFKVRSVITRGNPPAHFAIYVEPIDAE